MYTGATKREVMLKAILGACQPCCAEGSGGGASHDVACCPGVGLGDCLRLVISGGTNIDGTYTMTWNGTIWTTGVLPHPCAGGLLPDSFIFTFTTICVLTLGYITAGIGSPGPAFNTTSLQCTPFMNTRDSAVGILTGCNPFADPSVTGHAVITECA